MSKDLQQLSVILLFFLRINRKHVWRETAVSKWDVTRDTMRRLVPIFIMALVTVFLAVSGCQRMVPIVPGQSADDVVSAPGLGPTYRANIQQQGIRNPWPSVKTEDVILQREDVYVYVGYRDSIETKAGESRNDIVGVRVPSENARSPDVSLTVTNVPSGITVNQERLWGGPHAMKQLLIIEVARDVKPGRYFIQIGLRVNGRDYGDIPLTIIVVR